MPARRRRAEHVRKPRISPTRPSPDGRVNAEQRKQERDCGRAVGDALTHSAMTLSGTFRWRPETVGKAPFGCCPRLAKSQGGTGRE